MQADERTNSNLETDFSWYTRFTSCRSPTVVLYILCTCTKCINTPTSVARVKIYTTLFPQRMVQYLINIRPTGSCIYRINTRATSSDVSTIGPKAAGTMCVTNNNCGNLMNLDIRKYLNIFTNPLSENTDLMSNGADIITAHWADYILILALNFGCSLNSVSCSKAWQE